MVDLARFIESRGAVAATWELHTVGMNKYSIRAAVASGTILRVRQGWYCNPWLEQDAQRAARVGGQLACASAAQHLGLWVPEWDGALHVSVDPDACQLREPTDHRRRLSSTEVHVHWTGADSGFSRVVVSPLTAVRQIAHCMPTDFLHVVAESALNRRAITPAEWDGVLASLPSRVRAALPSVSTASGSGIESIFVSRIRALGLVVEQQVMLPGVGIVDVVIGKHLVVELDGAQFHRDDARDRRRDAVCSTLGYRVLRFLANQVTREWPLVEAAVIAAVVRGDHLRA